MKRLRILKKVLQDTNADKILISYFVFVFIDALIIWLADPGVDSYGNALWYCCSTISTAGYGDVVAVGMVGKIATVVLMAYSVIVLAIITGGIVNFYNQLIAVKQKETIVAFIHKLENLPEMSREELAELSKQVKKFERDKGLE